MKRLTYILLCVSLNLIIFGGIFAFLLGYYFEFMMMGILLLVFGLIIFLHQMRFGMQWNRVIRFAMSQEEISFDEISRRVRLPLFKVSDIMYDAIYSKTLPGVVRDDVFISRFKLARDGDEMID